MKVQSRFAMRGALAVAFISVLAVGCSSIPPGDYAAGDYQVDVVLPAQSISKQQGTCSFDITIAETPINGATAMLPAFEVVEGQTSLTLEGVALQIPAGTVALGQGSFACDGLDPTTIDFSITFEATVSAVTGTLDVAARTVTLDDSTIQLEGGLIEVDGLPGVPLPPVQVSVSSFVVEF